MNVNLSRSEKVVDEFDKFESYLFQEVRENILPIIEQNVTELNGPFVNELFNLKENRAKVRDIIGRKLSQKAVFLGQLFRGYVEIWDSYRNLKDIQIYIGRFPYSKDNISKVRNLHYNISNYMNEMYILKGEIKFILDKDW
jgi:hypothetical protein